MVGASRGNTMNLANNGNGASTGIRIIPPLVYLVGCVCGLILEYLSPSIDLLLSWRLSFALPILFCSILVIVLTLKEFQSVATPFDVRKTASSLITGGPFRFSRNPGYVALTLLYLAFAVVAGSIWVLLFVIPILLVIDLRVVRKEEANLLLTFGDEYREYQSTVRRWV